MDYAPWMPRDGHGVGGSLESLLVIYGECELAGGRRSVLSSSSPLRPMIAVASALCRRQAYIWVIHSRMCSGKMSDILIGPSVGKVPVRRVIGNDAQPLSEPALPE